MPSLSFVPRRRTPSITAGSTRYSTCSLSGLERPDLAAAEDSRQCRPVPATSQIAIRIQDRARPARECRKAVELKMTFQDEAVGCFTPKGRAHFPERGRPDEAVLVLIASLLEIVEGDRMIHPPQTGRI